MNRIVTKLFITVQPVEMITVDHVDVEQEAASQHLSEGRCWLHASFLDLIQLGGFPDDVSHISLESTFSQLRNLFKGTCKK